MDIEHMAPPPYLPHELIVSEILVRLPVKPLLRFRCVCKAWRDTVSNDTSFSQAHVRRHHGQPQKRRPSSLLIAPYIRNQHGADLEEKVHTPGLYLWEENQRRRQEGIAALVHDMAWFPEEDPTRQTRHGFAHCDGLVMLPTVDGTVSVLNLATRRGLKLPWSSNSAAAWCGRYRVENAFGFGRDPRSGLYKVARFFHHETIALATRRLGMEVFTIGSDNCWRETDAKPPCPFIPGRTATFFKGSLIWMADLVSLVYHEVVHFGDAASRPHFVCFSLEDESLSVLAAPQWYPGPDYMDSRLVELDGELALARLYQLCVEIWIYDDVDGDNPARWVRRHFLNFPLSIHPVASFDDGIVFRDMSDYLYRQTSEGSKHMVGMKTLKYHNPDTDTLVEYSSGTFAGFDVIPYFPTLVPL